MLDTHGRKYIQPVIEKVADVFERLGFTPNQVTMIAFFLGVGSGGLLFAGWKTVAFLTLWLSGLLDAVDGTLARRTKSTSWGTVLDITFDRVVELSVIVALAFRYPEATLYLLLLCGAIIISMTVFLTVGAVSENKGMKSFYYQAGLAERTEGFIMLSLMMLFSNFLIPLTLIFFAMVLYTAGQRLWEAKKILDVK